MSNAGLKLHAAYGLGFLLALEKTAAPAYVKKIRAGLLSPKSIDKVRSSLVKERQIRSLGEGSYQVADEVLHPTYGLAVRKIPRVDSARGLAGVDKDIAQTRAAFSTAHEQPWYRRLFGFGSQNQDIEIAKMLGHDGRRTYYERVEGAPTTGFYAHKERPRTSFSPETQAAINRVEKRHGPVSDLREGNIIRGKIVDFAVGSGVPLQRTMAKPSMARRFVLGQVSPAERALLDKGMPLSEQQYYRRFPSEIGDYSRLTRSNSAELLELLLKPSGRK